MSSSRSIMNAYQTLRGMEIVLTKERPPQRPPVTGDKVKVLPGLCHVSRIGSQGEIMSVDRGLYEVSFGSYTWWMDESEFELLN
jgi:hypothetical protein